MNSKLISKAKNIKLEKLIGSYPKEDCIFLLKDLSDCDLEDDVKTREKNNQNGVHYSETLPIEKEPTEEYMNHFYKTLEETKYQVKYAVEQLALKIKEYYGEDIVICSLARAGTPIGVLLSRYFKNILHISVPHYSISIIRGKGIDENALIYMTNQHPTSKIVFVDGWTGKGAISVELRDSCQKFNETYETKIEPLLNVLADPAKCAHRYGVSEDFTLPSACLNSTVSGLVSRTVERPDLIGLNEFHGAKYYSNWLNIDVSNIFVDTISSLFTDSEEDILIEPQEKSILLSDLEYCQGMKDVNQIMQEFEITSKHFVKPSIGECTRVLLRRVPWKILVKDINDPRVKHIIHLAQEKNAEIIEYPNMSYSVVGLIKQLNQEII